MKDEVGEEDSNPPSLHGGHKWSVTTTDHWSYVSF